MRQLHAPAPWRRRLGLLLLFLAAGGSLANADFIFREPVNLGPVINSVYADSTPCLSADGLELYFYHGDPGGIWVSRRATVDSEWERASMLNPIVNTVDSGDPHITGDGLTLFLSSDRWGGYGSLDLWMTTRPGTESEWRPAVNLGPTLNSDFEEWGPSLPDDGLEMYFMSDRPGGHGNYDLWVTRRATIDDDWGPPENVGPPVNTTASEAYANISGDGLCLLFSSNRPGGYGVMSDLYDIYMARRATRDSLWGAPVNLGSLVNSNAAQFGATFSPDGSMLYFHSNRSDGYGSLDIWQASVEPLADLNGDGWVDDRDVLRMERSWGQPDPQCDIGPMPFGDGIVDARDLTVLNSHIGEDVDDPTLIAHWALDETEGGIAHDGVTVKGGALVGDPIWRPDGGLADGALELDGIDDFVRVTHQVLNPANGPFSVFAWIKGGAPGQVLIAQIGGTNWLMADPSQGTLMTELSLTGRKPIPPLVCDAVISDGAWHRDALVWDGAERSLYVDDILAGQDTQLGMPECSGGLHIGCDADMTPGTFFSGLIDEIRVYNRAAKP